jgi:hypothetical protein
MAEYQSPSVQFPSYDPPQVPSQTGMQRLADIINVQKGQVELSKARQLLKPEVEGRIAENRKKVLEAEQAGVDVNQHYANIQRGTYGGLLTDPDFISGKPAEMKAKLEKATEYLKSIGVPEFDGGKSHNAILSLIDKDPKAAYQLIKNGVQVAGGNSAQYQSLQNAQPPAIYQPETIQGQPQGQPQGQVQGQIQNKTNNLPDYSQPVAAPYPVRAAGQPFNPAPSEASDMATGTKYRNDLVERQSQLTTDRRNIDEVIKTAHELEKSWMPTSGILGSAYRHLATWAGDPTYIQLSKDLANTQLSNMRALGLKTDSDKQLTAAANGDYTYPPEVLMNIAARAKADMTNIDMQATAAEKFKNRFGDNNMKKFQQEWSKNADSKIFELINVAKDPELSPAEKKKIADSLMGKDPKQREIFNEKYQNILKLQQTGTL